VVWEALTDPAHFNAWYNAAATIDARIARHSVPLAAPLPRRPSVRPAPGYRDAGG
jgi:hypothetical protein